MRNSISRKRLIIAFVLYLAVRICISVFPKVATTYADELLYLELAQNIWRKGVLSLFCVPVRFAKILYPLTLSPFFAIADPIARTTAISVFNAVLVSSALIPGWLIAVRMIQDRKRQLAAMVLLACMADMNFSVTFMAENLYLPLLLWGVYFLIRELDRDEARFGAAALAGCWCFLLYTAKESGAAFLAAASVLQLRRIVIRKGQRKQWIQAAAVFAAAFLVPFLALRLTLFAGMPYSYSAQAALSNLDSAGKWRFLLGSGASILLYFLLSLLILPAVAGLRRIRGDGRRDALIMLTGLYTLLTALGIAFAICLPDDFGSGDLRIHLRYFAGVPFLLAVLLLSGRERAGETVRNRLLSGRTAGTLLAIILSFLLLSPIRTGSLVDAPALEAMRLLPEGTRWPVVLLSLAGLALLGIWIIRGERAFIRWTAVALLCAQVANGTAFVLRASRSEGPEAAGEAILLDRLMDSLDGNMLVVKSSLYDARERTLDTYSNDDYYAVETEDLMQLAWESERPGVIDLAQAALTLPSTLPQFAAEEKYRAEHIDYIITSDPAFTLSVEENRDITPEGYRTWRVYRAETPEILYIFDQKRYRIGERISFMGETASFSGYVMSGFSAAESAFTWTGGNHAELLIVPEEDPAASAGLEMSVGLAMTLGKQRVRIRVNQVPVWEGTAEGAGEISFRIPEEALKAGDGRIRLEMDLPDAAQPGNGDPRELALAVQYMVLDAVRE